MRRQVAIKAVKRNNLSTKLFENLQSEIQILKFLSHRHITRLIDIVVCSLVIRPFVVSIYDRSELKSMECCAGGDPTSRSEDV